MDIRTARGTDWPAIWTILAPVFRAGQTYAIDPEISEQDARDYWLAATKKSFVAVQGETVLGTYYLTANFAGNADHICNCGYVTAGQAQGKGVARAMLLHSFDSARAAGFLGMQYNCVVSTNERAVAIWQAHGFKIVGTLPKAFRHPVEGFVDAFVMFRAV